MRNIGLFVEDFGHEALLTALVQRLAREHAIDITIIPSSVRGGHPKVVTELKQYARDLHRGHADWPDLIIVATDANCKGFAERKKEFQQAASEIGGQIIYAIPDPHVERWLLIDSAAFKAVFGRGCPAPDQKCERARYKRMLLDAMRDAGIWPPLGGMEFAEDIVKAMDLQRAGQLDDSLGKLLSELHTQFKIWSKI